MNAYKKMNAEEPTTGLDFNDAGPQQSFSLIPKGTIAKVRLALKPGGYNDPARTWTGGYATYNAVSGAIYLDCAFTLLEGPYAKRKVWSLIGLHSPKGPTWHHQGRAFIRAILNSARGFSEEDASPEAVEARKLKSLAELDGIEFVARIGVEQDGRTGEERNVIKLAVAKGHKDYPLASQTQAAPSGSNVPSWAR